MPLVPHPQGTSAVLCSIGKNAADPGGSGCLFDKDELLPSIAFY